MKACHVLNNFIPKIEKFIHDIVQVLLIILVLMQPFIIIIKIIEKECVMMKHNLEL